MGIEVSLLVFITCRKLADTNSPSTEGHNITTLTEEGYDTIMDEHPEKPFPEMGMDMQYVTLVTAINVREPSSFCPIPPKAGESMGYGEATNVCYDNYAYNTSLKE